MDWTLKEKNAPLFEFFKFMIHFREKHTVIRRDMPLCSQGFPAVSTHGTLPWAESYTWDSKLIAVMFAGRNEEDTQDDIVYVVINAYWEAQAIRLPRLIHNAKWKCVVDTWCPDSIMPEDIDCVKGAIIEIGPRTTMVLTTCTE